MNTTKTTPKQKSQESRRTKNSCGVCTVMRRGLKILLKGFLLAGFLVTFTSVLYASSEAVTTGSPSLLIQLANLGITAGVLIYAMRTENRLTRLETMMELLRGLIKAE